MCVRLWSFSRINVKIPSPCATVFREWISSNCGATVFRDFELCIRVWSEKLFGFNLSPLFRVQFEPPVSHITWSAILFL